MLYKLIILYMLKNAENPLTNSQISDFMLEGEYTNYFHLQQLISDLEASGLIESESVRNTTTYCLTKEGITTLSYFDSEISPDIKKDVKTFLHALGKLPDNPIAAVGDYYETPKGDFSANCQLLEGNVSRLNITLSLPTEEAAKALCKNWSTKAQDIYAYLMEELL